MAGVISEERHKELLAKRKYYREHPEEAKRDSMRSCAGKFGNDYIPVPTPPQLETK